MPKNAARDTREAILSTALRLFSEHGYAGVSIRDIAQEIGIRESALYKHFSGKHDIFDSILHDVEQRYRKEVNSSRTVSSELLGGFMGTTLGERDPREQLFTISLTMFRFYLLNEYGSQLRRMLTIEQYASTDAGEYFRELIIDNGLDYIQKTFASLIAAGIYIDADPQVMAVQFYAPIYLLLSQFDGKPDRYSEAQTLLEKHMSQFDEAYLNQKRM